MALRLASKKCERTAELAYYWPRGTKNKERNNAASFAVPESLKEWEVLFRVHATASKVGLCILDMELRYVAINHAMAEMNGVAVQEHLGKSVREILGDFVELIEPHLANVAATGQAVLNREVSAVLPEPD